MPSTANLSSPGKSRWDCENRTRHSWMPSTRCSTECWPTAASPASMPSTASSIAGRSRPRPVRGSGGSLDRLLGQAQVPVVELLPRFRQCRVQRDAIHGADFLALRAVVVADALGAFVRIDLVDLFALENGVVRALRLAHVAVDAFVGDHQGHKELTSEFSPSTAGPRSD